MNPSNEHCASLLGYLNKELRGQALKDFSAHLSTCADCKEQLEEEQALSHLLRQSRPLYPAPPDLRARVYKVLAESSAKDRVPYFPGECAFDFLRHPLRDAARLARGAVGCVRSLRDHHPQQGSHYLCDCFQRIYRSSWWR